MSESEKTTQAASPGKPKRRRRKPRRRQSGWDLRQFKVPAVAGKWRFHDFDLPLPLMRAIHAQGFEYCTPIQADTLRHTLLGGDVLGRAETGTGKTAAFLISILAYFLEEKAPDGQRNGAPRALIIAPTRELALQIGKDARALARFTSLNVATAAGGEDSDTQREALGKTVDILVATPGRLLDFQQKGELDPSQTEVLVLDETDRLLAMGFMPDVRQVVDTLPGVEERQTFLFAGALNDDVLGLAERWTRSPARIEVDADAALKADLDQRVYEVADSDKSRLLIGLLRQDDVQRALVFCNRRDLVRQIAAELEQAGIGCAALSGDVPLAERIETLEQFRAGKSQVLVATDVIGRGVHIDDVPHVINYTLPEDPADYAYRIGRNASGGANGVTISLAGEEDAFALPEIERYLDRRLPREQPPQDLL